MLCALRKANTSLRPLAANETVRRLCGKVAVELMGFSIRSYLEPIQVGVQTRSGCEAVGPHNTPPDIHPSWRPGPVLVLVDLANAVNCVSRSAPSSAARTHFLGLASLGGYLHILAAVRVGMAQITRLATWRTVSTLVKPPRLEVGLVVARNKTEVNPCSPSV